MPLYNNPDMYPKSEPASAAVGEIPSLELMNAVESGSGLTLEQLFGENTGDESVLQHMLDVALLKVMYTFLNPAITYDRAETGQYKLGVMANPRSGRRRAVHEHFLPVVDSSLDALTRLVLRSIPKAYKFVRTEDLLPEHAALIPTWRDKVRTEARRVLVLEVVSELESEQTDMWYIEYPCHNHAGWQVSAGLMAGFSDLQRGLAGYQPLQSHFRRKVDRRNWHGRPLRDRENGTPEGVSVGRGPFDQRR